jgi:hypothetical protein
MPELLEWEQQFQLRHRLIGPRAQARALFNSILSHLTRPSLWNLLAAGHHSHQSGREISMYMQPALANVNIVTANVSPDAAWLSSKTALFGFIIMEINALFRYRPRIHTIFGSARDACVRIIGSTSPFLRLTSRGEEVMKGSWRDCMKDEERESRWFRAQWL